MDGVTVAGACPEATCQHRDQGPADGNSNKKGTKQRNRQMNQCYQTPQASSKSANASSLCSHFTRLPHAAHGLRGCLRGCAVL